MIVIAIDELFGKTAKLEDINLYVDEAKGLAGKGNDVLLTGAAPVWLYLKIAHALHGMAKSLTYNSPVTGNVVIFDHNPF